MNITSSNLDKHRSVTSWHGSTATPGWCLRMVVANSMWTSIPYDSPPRIIQWIWEFPIFRQYEWHLRKGEGKKKWLAVVAATIAQTASVLLCFEFCDSPICLLELVYIREHLPENHRTSTFCWVNQIHGFWVFWFNFPWKSMDFSRTPAPCCLAPVSQRPFPLPLATLRCLTSLWHGRPGQHGRGWALPSSWRGKRWAEGPPWAHWIFTNMYWLFQYM